MRADLGCDIAYDDHGLEDALFHRLGQARGCHWVATSEADVVSDRTPQLVIMVSGAALIVTGLVLITVQFYQEVLVLGSRPASRSIETDPSGGLKLTTTYVGLVVVAIGALLETVGYLAALPWRRSGS